ncbi:MAG: D-lyxose/D-mannose family sugar isomerase [Anaerolineae bacterium]|nr:D-lyxose/D-mannose family sugar isomerase [Anaerolineae bacterium]
MTKTEYRNAQRRAAKLLKRTGVTLRDEELATIAVADFGLGELEGSGGQILTLLDTTEIATKLIALLPGQTLPEHRHPRLGDYSGKAETLRCEWGVVFLYTEGNPTPEPRGHPPAHRRQSYTVWHEVVLLPGDQITLPPDTPHWFQAGPEGGVVWSFSSRAVDVQDIFTDPEIRRVTVVVEDA